MRFLSIQSAVAYGHAGNSAAAFPLQRLGVEVMPIYTVVFSNQTGYGTWRGRVTPPEEVRELVDGIDELGVLPEVDAVLTGYQGSERIAEVIVETVRRVKSANPAAIYACDPVLGNAKTGIVLAAGMLPMYRDEIVPVADLITPNQFELGLLTGTAPSTLEEILEAADLARALGPRTVLVTSVERPEGDPATIETLAVDDAGAWLVANPRLPHEPTGSGDVAAALFTAHYLRSRDAADALGRTVSTVYELLERTYRADSQELLLVEGQDSIVAPQTRLEVRRIR